jgi:hypothetical protein
MAPALGQHSVLARLHRDSWMTSVGTILLYAFGLYVAAGILVGLAFVVAGVTRVLEHPATVTLGARILLFPAAAALWPLVLRRWIRARARP